MTTESTNIVLCAAPSGSSATFRECPCCDGEGGGEIWVSEITTDPVLRRLGAGAGYVWLQCNECGGGGILPDECGPARAFCDDGEEGPEMFWVPSFNDLDLPF